jgi:hypothetical protein
VDFADTLLVGIAAAVTIATGGFSLCDRLRAWKQRRARIRLPTDPGSSVAFMARRVSLRRELADLRRDFEGQQSRVADQEQELVGLRREVAEMGAGYSDVLELLVACAVPHDILQGLLALQARDWRWSVERRPDYRAVLRLEHPTEDVHTFSIEVPVSEEASVRSEIMVRIRMHTGALYAA